MYSVYSFDRKDLSLMPKRTAESNKGSYGKLLCVCGSSGMCGAAYLAAKAAYRTGAGLVRILTHKDNLIPLQASLPEAIVTVYDPCDMDFNLIADVLEWADTAVIGCGLGNSAESRALLSYVLRNFTKSKILDADALNIISANPTLKKYLNNSIITPHPLEMHRLTGIELSEILEKPNEVAYNFAKKYETVCVLKLHRTVVSDGGERIYVNQSGNDGMATAGSGDVLAGILGGILAQNKLCELSLTDVAALGVYVHGLAGDAAAEELGRYSLMASDIINALPKVLR